MNDCFICCTKSGKSEQDKFQDVFLNRRTYNYPLIQLSSAYGCNCSNAMAHNKCLLGIKKCPTCRKVVIKPNLYVETKFDWIFSWLFGWLKSNSKLIPKLKIWCGISCVIMFILFLMIDKQLLQFSDNWITQVILGPLGHFFVVKKTWIGLSLLLGIQLIGGIVLIMEDYIKKYWLYNPKTNQIDSY